MILMIDNYDSFTYNLVQYLGELGEEVEVHRNDAISVDTIAEMQPDAILISPGPGNPDEAGISLDTVRRFAGRIPILGVCLGHQTIAQAFGGKVVRAGRLMHGKTSPVHHDGRTLFEGIPSPFEATRYHSLIVERESLPEEFEISAETAEGEIMAMRHRRFPLEGVQFHPESILTREGKRLLANFLNTYREDSLLSTGR
ncbi:aminodeoxychorismate/anthranilate synthase component 2 [Marinithermofilum abyssi]|uniref:Aminodeoxychorismate/anthranilate synthase component 2 n=1 Tax=Marinithermofilum abyssi TaxID=1571185 RepID=A0A8J2VE32_9BACL|nr:aminodeoxychorismate/anthranilate synthase component II [Marinithermofilum abyssi]GGE21663.1 aminodeoxychorismate/anthranilate synthase component 2 [Marinithermofilum abyssi]